MILTSQNLVYKAVYHGARAFAEVFAAIEVEGWETVPNGACIFASNHQSMLDPPVIGSCLPREISFIARRSLFDNPVLGAVLSYCHCIPVDRGEADIGAIRSALAALAQGRGLMIFPEGTRSADGVIGEAKAGAGLLACKSGVPVIPIHIRGARDVLPRGAFFPTGGARVRVRFGKALLPADYDPGEGVAGRTMEASRRILAAIKALPDYQDPGL
ncbi:MAG: 1-acyl-sn-glycerol-3-phosphate acyltransferase [Verrucomicrobiota bacterium]|jgi:1-acyl-sn-glycerol-3-phosphate acyltransferase|nr:MAG: 1-acyl-sn-glycerol-3-phosphate acyltransferase [Opitutae bacterium]